MSRVLATFTVVGEPDDKVLRGWTEGDKQESTHDELTFRPDAWEVGTTLTVHSAGEPPLADTERVEALREAVDEHRERADHFAAELVALQATHYRRVYELTRDLDTLSDALTQKVTFDEPSRARAFTAHRRVMQTRADAQAERIEQLEAELREAKTRASEADARAERLSSSLSYLRQRLAQRRADGEQSEHWLIEMAARASALRKLARQPGIAAFNDLMSVVNEQIDSGEFGASFIVNNDVVGRCVLAYIKHKLGERAQGCRVLAPAPVVVMLREHATETQWLTPADIALRFVDVEVVRVEKIATLLGLHETKHCELADETTRVNRYSPEAVGLIERELRSRGSRLRGEQP